MGNTIKTLDELVSKMNWQAARGKRLNQNLANADSPGYKRVDLKPFKEVYNPNSKRPFAVSSSHEVTSSDELSRENEVIELTENLADYQANMQLFRKYLGLMRTVLGKTQ